MATPIENQPSNNRSSIPGDAPWDVEEALTWVTYGFFRHLKNNTRPEAAELTDWWNQLLAVQVEIGALIKECVSISKGSINEQGWQRVTAALSRLRANEQAWDYVSEPIFAHSNT